jgi:hypothetical protein
VLDLAVSEVMLKLELATGADNYLICKQPSKDAHKNGDFPRIFGTGEAFAVLEE